ncbi:lytic transglycosylase domain-containing protein [Thermopolyspora sp. NPDC052614]|uniref:lytic transglycosylase domain-containing protein n=1 Tax=Thermopolyspora sp. NPDC052614 TaxID=3155682 RepID=UPI003414BF87
MRDRRLAVVLAVALAAGVGACGGTGYAEGARAGERGAAPSAQAAGSGTRAAAEAPRPDQPIPGSAAALARTLARNETELRAAIDAWVRDGDPGKGRPPEPVVLHALYQQRIYRHLARDPGLSARVTDRLPSRLARDVRAEVAALRDLFALTRPISGPVRFKVREPEPADVLLKHFRRAERRFGVDWEVLAAVMFSETKFGRVRSPSHTGALGPMQFMPRTWAAYGMGGNVHDTGDAIMGAANYLKASGTPRDYKKALFAYNHSNRYVNAVWTHARQMMRDRRNFYAYYNWQVFVLTTKGDRRLTGPGL